MKGARMLPSRMLREVESTESQFSGVAFLHSTEAFISFIRDSFTRSSASWSRSGADMIDESRKPDKIGEVIYGRMDRRISMILHDLSIPW
jgi:hypothetical protein